MSVSYFIGLYCKYYQTMSKELAYKMDDDNICWYDDGVTQFYGNCSLDGEKVSKMIQDIVNRDSTDVDQCIIDTCGEF